MDLVRTWLAIASLPNLIAWCLIGVGIWSMRRSFRTRDRVNARIVEMEEEHHAWMKKSSGMVALQIAVAQRAFDQRGDTFIDPQANEAMDELYDRLLNDAGVVDFMREKGYLP